MFLMYIALKGKDGSMIRSIAVYIKMGNTVLLQVYLHRIFHQNMFPCSIHNDMKKHSTYAFLQHQCCVCIHRANNDLNTKNKSLL